MSMTQNKFAFASSRKVLAQANGPHCRLAALLAAPSFPPLLLQATTYCRHPTAPQILSDELDIIGQKLGEVERAVRGQVLCLSAGQKHAAPSSFGLQLCGHSGAAAATRLATKTAAAPPATRLISPTVSFQTIIDFLSIAEGWLALKGYKIFKPDPFPLIPTVPRLFM